MCASGRRRYAQAIADQCRRRLISQDDMANNSIERPEPPRGETKKHQPTMRAILEDPIYKRPKMMRRPSPGLDSGVSYDEGSIWSMFPLRFIRSFFSPPKEPNPNETEVKRVIEIQAILYHQCTLSNAEVLAVVQTATGWAAKWFDYQKFKEICGAREAVDQFRPIYE